MDQQDTDQDNDIELPDDVADAWAVVLIDVHEKAIENSKTSPGDIAKDASRMNEMRGAPRSAKNGR